jgi:cell division septation protein DedD
MKKIVLAIILVALAAVAMPSCKKKKTDTEAGLIVEITPANKSNNLNLLGPDFPLKIEITSVMPPSGIKIEISVIKEGSSDPAFFTASNNSTAPQNNYTITGTPSGVTCVVNITVTSLSMPTNKWVGTYRYSKK